MRFFVCKILLALYKLSSPAACSQKLKNLIRTVEAEESRRFSQFVEWHVFSVFPFLHFLVYPRLVDTVLYNEIYIIALQFSR